MLREVLLHTPSEHTLDGRRFDLEMQLVHVVAHGEVHPPFKHKKLPKPHNWNEHGGNLLFVLDFLLKHVTPRQCTLIGTGRLRARY